MQENLQGAKWHRVYQIYYLLKNEGESEDDQTECWVSMIVCVPEEVMTNLKPGEEAKCCDTSTPVGLSPEAQASLPAKEVYLAISVLRRKDRLGLWLELHRDGAEDAHLF